MQERRVRRLARRAEELESRPSASLLRKQISAVRNAADNIPQLTEPGIATSAARPKDFANRIAQLDRLRRLAAWEDKMHDPAAARKWILREEGKHPTGTLHEMPADPQQQLQTFHDAWAQLAPRPTGP